MPGRLSSARPVHGWACSRLGLVALLLLALGLPRGSGQALTPPPPPPLPLPPPPPQAPGKNPDEYRKWALRLLGNAARGKALFENDQRSFCTRCHTIDGTGARAGPDLRAIGDKFGRNEIMDAILAPSAAIADGYNTTVIETKSGETHAGVVKQATDSWVELMNIEGRPIRVAVRDIKERRTTNVSLMPEGLAAGLSLQEFTDLVEYLATLKQPESAASMRQGMPATIQPLARPVVLRPFISEALRLPHSTVRDPIGIRLGTVWFGQIPGLPQKFLVIHQSGKIWLLEKKETGDTLALFGDFSKEIYCVTGPNGLMSLAFHPQFRQNQRYFLVHQVVENGKLMTVVVEKRATPDGLHDSGQPSRRLLAIEATTVDHTGGCLAFGPDGCLYVGMGDTGPQQDPQGHGQDMSLLLGKMLRIDVDATAPGLPYGIPADNPFRNQAGARPEIWALGIREPWRFSFDTLNGDLWVGDVGQSQFEEVDILHRGENYGWNVFEGFEPFSNHYRRPGSAYVPPVFAYNRRHGSCVTGGYVYRGNPKSSFYGVYICGDYVSRRIWGLTQKDGVLTKIRELVADVPVGIASFGTDEQGGIYVVGYEGMIYKIDFDQSVFE